MPKPVITAILLMGGEGIRFGSPLPKQLHKIGGKPIFLHTLEKFLQLSIWKKIILPIPPKWEKEIREALSFLKTETPIELITGGKTRQESSYLALLACDANTDYVVIHDAVRPFICKEILENNIKEVLIHKAVDTCIPSADTLVFAPNEQTIGSIPSRKHFLRGQTPQSFSFPLILQAHQHALKEGILNSSDDCSLLLRLSHPIKITPGSELNIKITTELDLFLAERLLYYPSNTCLEAKDDLTGKKFVVTGANGGIGKALCHALRSLGAIPIEISRSACNFPTDLTSYEETQKTFSMIYNEYGLIDGIINSVGTFSLKELKDISPSEIQNLIASNLTSVIYSCKCALLKKGGHIINISSSSYSRGRKEYPIYSAAKAAVVNFTQALAESLPLMKVNVLVPQRTDTPLRRQSFPDEEINSLLQPKEIADKIIEVLQNKTLTGTIIEIRKTYSL